MSAPANLHGAWAAALLGALARSGARHAVISPGSRSTPLALAAAREPGLECTVVVDERSAAFHALGVARVTGLPALLICTSGTAPAHYLPAVIEASESGVPLIALTADRPPRLQHRRASQTIDQVRLFGPFARRYVELGLPQADARAFGGLVRGAAIAWAAALGPPAGPVQVNAWFDKPLEPRPDNDADEALRTLAREAVARHVPVAHAARRLPAPEALAALRALVSGARRGVFVCGPGRLGQAALRAALVRAAAATGFPIVAEAGSQCRFAMPRGSVADLFDPLWHDEPDARFVPDLIVQLGAPPVSAAYDRLLARHPEIPRVVVAADGWNDPHNQAALMLEAEPVAVLEALDGADAPSEWRACIEAAVARCRAEAACFDDGFSEPGIARTVLAACPPGSLLALGNSLPIRCVDLAVEAAATQVGVIVQRGAAGIDGMLSSAAGAARAAGTSLTLYLGDLSFLHDLHGLLLCRTVHTPLAIVAVNNGGGQLFAQLPVRHALGDAGEFERLFLAGQGVDLAPVAASLGLAACRVATLPALRSALAAAHGSHGCTVIEVDARGATPAGDALAAWRARCRAALFV